MVWHAVRVYAQISDFGLIYEHTVLCENCIIACRRQLCNALTNTECPEPGPKSDLHLSCILSYFNILRMVEKHEDL